MPASGPCSSSGRSVRRRRRPRRPRRCRARGRCRRRGSGRASNSMSASPVSSRKPAILRPLAMMSSVAWPMIVVGQLHRAAGMRAAAGRDPRGVVRDVIDAVERHAEPFGDELGEARLVALAGRHRAHHQLDPALGQHGDLGALARRAAGDLDIIGDADAAQPAASLCRRRGAPESRPNRRAPAPCPSPPGNRRCRR